jgi:radical SAM protein with 4Fe4S-binding SPASM domain
VADRFRIDGHKLLYHLPRVVAWLEEKPVYPISMEISPSGACNHRCLFCAVDYLDYQPRFLDAAVLTARLTELAGLGLKSVMYAGEGEPLLHREIAGIVAHTRAVGIEAALVTNAVLLREEVARALLPHLTWVKVSCNAGTAATYAAVHRTRAEDFERVMANLAAAVRIRREEGLSCTIGIQILLLPENAAEVATLAHRAREIGLDYLVVKPYSHFDRSRTTRYRTIRYEEYRGLAAEVGACATPEFDVVFREETMRLWDAAERTYDRCVALPFYSYIDAGGTVWGCKEYLGDERFAFGNINEQTFREIWDGPRRAAVMRFVAAGLDVRGCRTNCRLDKMNRWLWEVSHPAAHANFI